MIQQITISKLKKYIDKKRGERFFYSPLVNPKTNLMKKTSIACSAVAGAYNWAFYFIPGIHNVYPGTLSVSETEITNGYITIE